MNFRSTLTIILLIAATLRSSAADAPAAPDAARTGTVRVGMNVFDSGYANVTPRFANVLLNFTGFYGGPLTAEGVGMKSGTRCFYEIPAGILPVSTDDRATQYQLTYHCDDPDRDSWRNQRETIAFNGWTVVSAPVGDAHGDYVGWLSFAEPPAKERQLALTVTYAPAVCGADGVAKYPFTRLKLRYPGCSDTDFITPLYRERMGGFTRLRFCDAGGMNGRAYSRGLTVPGQPAAKTIGAVVADTAANVQTQMQGDAGLSWGKGVGQGNPLTFWNGKEWTTFPWGWGCKAPCTLVFPLARRFDLFMCNPAVDHEVDAGRAGPHGDVTLTVWTTTADHPQAGDWKKVQQIEHLTSARGQVGITLDVTGLTYMKFEVADNGDPDGHLDIINSRLWEVTKWANRMPPTWSTCSYASPWMSNVAGHLGPVLEYLIRECDELHCDAMFNVPFTADDEYLHNFARILLYGSDERGQPYASKQDHPVNPPLDCAHGRTVYLEEDNEVWNWGYNCWMGMNDRAQFHHRPLYCQFALDAAHMSEVIKGEFAAAGFAKNVKVVFSNNLVAEGTSAEAFDYLSKQNGGKPITTWFDCYAVAPYFGPDNARMPPRATLDDIFRLAVESLDERIGNMRENAAFAAKYHLEPTTYEGGIEMTLTGDATDALRRQAMAHRRSGMILDRYFAAWQAMAGRDAITNYYSGIDAARFNGGGQWAVLPMLSEGMPGSVRYDAVLRASHPAGDCDNDQRVTYADFQVLKRNFGHGHWWSQGDFDNNGDVGLDDYYLMLANLSAEDRQRADVRSFPDEHPGPYLLGPASAPQGGYFLRTWKDNERPQAVTIEARTAGPQADANTAFAFTEVAAPRHGALALDGYPRLGYTPVPGYVGIDECQIAVKDAAGRQSNPMWVWIDVKADALNGSFEDCAPRPAPGAFTGGGQVSVDEWTLSGGAGICAAKSPFLNGSMAPANGQVAAYLQGAGSSLTHRVDIDATAAGAYTLRFAGLLRNTGKQVTIGVTVDGTPMAPEPFVLSATNAWTTCTTPSFELRGGEHALAISLVGGDARDLGAAIDAVALAPFKPLAEVSVSALPASPQPAYTPITLAARAVGGATLQYQFLVDGAVAQEFSPASTCVWTPKAAAACAIVVKAKDHDGTSVSSAAPLAFTVAAPAAVIQNGSFELCLPRRPELAAFAYAPAVSVPGWTFVSSAGICASKGAFLNGEVNAANGDVVAFLQGARSRISQPVEFTAAGTFEIGFKAVIRGTSKHVMVSVLLDDQAVTPTPFDCTSTKAWTALTTPPFAVTAGPHTLAIAVTGGDSNDYTANIDAVTLTPKQ